MNNQKMVGIALLIVGIIALVVGLFADSLGIGGVPGLGYKQIVAAVVGVVLAIGGFVMMTRK